MKFSKFLNSHTDPEICICAAIRTIGGKIIRGHRHHDCIHTLSQIPIDNVSDYRDYERDENSQGFITSKNRFVSREEGYQLQIKAGIESVAEGGYRHERLYSEDLY